MKCGVPDCGVVIDYSYVELITEPKIFNVYKEKMVEAFKKTNKRIVVCPTNNCHSCIELFSDQKDDDGVQHECVNCHLVYCTKCECEWHEGYSCNDYLDLVVEADFMKESKVPIYTRCPGCKHAV